MLPIKKTNSAKIVISTAATAKATSIIVIGTVIIAAVE
jgi:hypothetical protein